MSLAQGDVADQPPHNGRPARAPARRSPLVHVALLGLTFLTAAAAGALFEGADPFDAAWLARGCPYAVTLLFILLANQIGPFFLARRNRVAMSLPWLLPAPPQFLFTGTGGALLRADGTPPDRRALFDIGVAGTWGGFAAAALALVLGLSLSEARPLTAGDPGGMMLGESLLSTLLIDVVLGIDADTVSISLHPIALAGWVGTLLTGLSLLPIGQLNGGHIAYALLGERGHHWISRGTVTTLFVLGVGGWYGWLIWLPFLIVFVGLRHPPTGDDTVEIGRRRVVLACLSVALLVAVFLPKPVYHQPPPVVIPERGLRAV